LATPRRASAAAPAPHAVSIGHNESDQGLPWLNQSLQDRGMYPERCPRLQQSFFPTEDWLVNQARGVQRLP
jgi:hypothetical protein